MTERRTPFYDFHRRSARNLVKGGGDFMFPTSYASSLEEHLNVRRNVGMQDLSTMGEVDIKGPGAERLVRRLLVNEVQDMEPGHLRYSTMCNEEGGIVDDVTCYKFDDEHFMVVTSSGPREKVYRWISDRAAGSSAYVTDLTAAVALPVVQGPRSRAFLKTVVDGVDLDELRFFRFAPCRIGDIELIISRSGYTCELGYELYTPADQASALWEYLLQAGRSFNFKPYGLEAMLQVQERGGEGRGVRLPRGGEFPATPGAGVFGIADVATFRDVVETGAEAGEQEDELMPGERPIGRVTSSAMGHTVGRMLAMAYVDTAHSWPGNNLVVELGGRPIPA